jgi:hypothetical protein
VADLGESCAEYQDGVPAASLQGLEVDEMWSF